MHSIDGVVVVVRVGATGHYVVVNWFGTAAV